MGVGYVENVVVLGLFFLQLNPQICYGRSLSLSYRHIKWYNPISWFTAIKKGHLVLLRPQLPYPRSHLNCMVPLTPLRGDTSGPRTAESTHSVH